jgi:hypothetical protein
MVWKGGFSVGEEDLDLDSMGATMRQKVSSSQIKDGSIRKQSLSVDLQTEIANLSNAAAQDAAPVLMEGSVPAEALSSKFQREIDNIEGLAVRGNSPVHMAGSIPAEALTNGLQRRIDNLEGMSAGGNSPVHMAGSIPAAAADLTDDWSFKRIGLHVGTTIASSGGVAVGTASVYLVNTTSGSVTVSLPAASTCANMTLTFKKIAAGNNMILDADGSETIDGAETKSYSANNTWVTIISNGSGWYIIAVGA